MNENFGYEYEDEMDQYKGKKLSEIITKDEKAFAIIATRKVDDSRTKFRQYRESCNKSREYWKNRTWGDKTQRTKNEPQPNVPVLHATIENCVADSMDNYPTIIIRGVNGDDDLTATVMTESLRFTTQRSNHIEKYEKTARACHIIGSGVRQTFFNPELAKGQGDIDYRYIDIKDFAWDPSVVNIDDGMWVATLDYISDEAFREIYPDVDLTEVNARMRQDRDDLEDTTDYRDDNQGEDNEIINIYWKELEPRTVVLKDIDKDTETEKSTGTMRTFMNSAKIIGEHVLEYHLKQYEYDSFMFRITPFVPRDEDPVGLSMIDLFKDQADMINRIEQEYIKNLQAASNLRFLVNNGANVDEDELMDFNQRLIHADVIHEGAVREFKVDAFNNQALTYMQNVMGRIKEFSGQLDVNIGQSSAGVTAASAIMALQDYGAKRNRLFNRRCYHDFKKEMRDTIFLMKEHYTTKRIIRISAEARAIIEKQQNVNKNSPLETAKAVMFEGNRAKVDYSMLDLDNFDLDYDIEIIPQKKNAATSNLLNSVVQQLASSGAIPGDLLIELLEVEGKDKIVRKYRERMGVEKQMEDMQKMMAQLSEQQQQVMSENEKLNNENKKLVQQVMKEQFNLLREQVKNMSSDGESGPESAQQAISQLEQRQLAAAGQL